MNRLLRATLVVLALTIPVANAQDSSDYIGDYTIASGLARDCSLPSEGSRTTEHYIAIGRCMAYFDGFRDAYQIEQTFRQVASALTDDLSVPSAVVSYYQFCWPTALQTHPARTFVAFLDRHPHRLTESSSDVLAAAMEEAYGLADSPECE